MNTPQSSPSAKSRASNSSTPPTSSTLPTSPPADSAARVSIPVAWLVIGGLAGFSACLLLAVVVLGMALWLRSTGPESGAPAGDSTVAASPAAADAAASPHIGEPASVDGASGAGASVPATAVSPNAGAGPAAVGDPSTPAIIPAAEGSSAPASAPSPSEVLAAVTAEFEERARAAGPPPTVAQQGALGAAGALDVLREPEPLPRGMLPFLRGLAQLHSQQTAAALASFTEAVEADDENARYYAARGTTQVLMEKMEQGLPDLQRATRLDPKNVFPSRMTRLALLMMGDQLQASKHHGHGGHAKIDFLITEVGVGYGLRVMARRMNYKLDVRDQVKADAAVQKLPTLMRLAAETFSREDEATSQGMFALGVDQFRAGDYPAARRSFDAVLEKSPYDWTSRYYRARSLLESGDPELARRELTFLSGWMRFLPEAYATRALCAARQNDRPRAQADLARAQSLDRAKAEEAVAAVAALQAAPAPVEPEADAALWQDLVSSAAADASFDALLEKATKLRRSVDARRRRWDETYQDRLFELVLEARKATSAGTASQRADRLAEVAQFLRDQHSVLGVQAAPHGAVQQFRQQTPETARWEIELAYALAQEGLNADPRHAHCWALKAAILLHTYSRLAEAEKAAEYAVQFDPQRISGHLALSDCYGEYAIRLQERAAALRMPTTATRSVEVVDGQGRFVRYDTETYYIPPTPAALALAAECDRQAAVYAERKDASLRRVVAIARGTREEPFYQAVYLYQKKDYAGARPWLEQAVRDDPEDARARRRLANCLQRLELEDEATEALAQAVNLEHTTAALWLQVAWTKLERSSWTAAEKALQRAVLLDPADARVAAYQSVLESFGRNNPGAAQGATFAALAQEEARARANQTTFLPAADGLPLDPEDVGLTLMLRLKGGKAFFKQRPAVAAEYYLATAGIESRLGEWSLASPTLSAMLPYPERDPQQSPSAPTLVTILKSNRIYCGQALLNANRGADAAAQFAAAENFAHRLPAGGTAYLDQELEPPYIPFRVSSMPMYSKALHAAALLQQGRKDEARMELQQVRYYLANRSLEQQAMTDDPIPGLYARLAPAVGLR